MEKEKKLSPTPVISTESCAYKLGILLIDLNKIIVEKNIDILSNYENKPAIKNTDFDLINSDPCIDNLRMRYVHSKIDELKKNEKFESKQADALKKICIYLEKKITRLSEIYEEINNRIEIDEHETGITSSLLIYSKIISISKSILILLKSENWNVGSMVREIMECQSMAAYFIEFEKVDKGKSHLVQWFRKDISPPLWHVRQKMAYYNAAFYSSRVPEPDNSPYNYPQFHFDLESDLYNKKSKFTHSSYGSIFDIADFKKKGSTYIIQPNLGDKFRYSNLREIAKYAGSSFEPKFEYNFFLFFI